MKASVDDLSAHLDTDAPETVHHFTVSSSESHDVSAKGTFTWDAAEPNREAAVLVRIDSDDGRSAETIYRASDTDGEDAELMLSLSTECSGPDACQMGYTVKLKLVDGWPTEHVDVDWSFRASIGGDDAEEPEGAFVEAAED